MKDAKKKKLTGTVIFAWIVGIIYLYLGILGISTSRGFAIVVSLAFIIASLFILPLFSTWLFEKRGIRINRAVRIIIGLIPIILAIILNVAFISVEDKEVNCLADKDCFRENMLGCHKARYTQCSELGTCFEAAQKSK